MNLPLPQDSSIVTLTDAQRIQAVFMAASEGPRARTCRCNYATTNSFIHYLCDTPSGAPDRLILNADRLLQWMIHDCGGRSVRYAVVRLGIVKRYLQAIHVAGLTSANLMEDFRTTHGRRPWNILVTAMQSRDPATAIQAMEVSPSSLVGPLHQHVQEYLETQESLGRQYRLPRQVLGDLDRRLCAWGVTSPQAVDAGMIQRWLNAHTCSQRMRRESTCCVRRFFSYLEGMQIVTKNPLPSTQFAETRPVPTAFRPYIFTREQLASLLAHVEQLSPTHTFSLRGPTCHLMLSLLYTLGLRGGEARHLRIRDLDMDRQTLMIVKTKFHKNRLVPFGPKLGQRLHAYLEQRRRLFRVCHDDDPLFAACHRKPMVRGTLLAAFRAGLRSIGLTAHDRVALPRLHDLRHTFAVHRLLRWYEEGIDVQNRLPVLATFMGHVSISSTQVYLTITSDLLQVAHGRFYQHFGRQFDTEEQP